MQFSWDPSKATSNAKKHGVRFTDAVAVFEDPLALYVQDELYEDRAILIGQSKRGLLYVVFADVSDEEIRIISARRATSHERRRYEEGE